MPWRRGFFTQYTTIRAPYVSSHFLPTDNESPKATIVLYLDVTYSRSNYILSSCFYWLSIMSLWLSIFDCPPSILQLTGIWSPRAVCTSCTSSTQWPAHLPKREPLSHCRRRACSPQCASRWTSAPRSRGTQQSHSTWGTYLTINHTILLSLDRIIFLFSIIKVLHLPASCALLYCA